MNPYGNITINVGARGFSVQAYHLPPLRVYTGRDWLTVLGKGVSVDSHGDCEYQSFSAHCLDGIVRVEVGEEAYQVRLDGDRIEVQEKSLGQVTLQLNGMYYFPLAEKRGYALPPVASYEGYYGGYVEAFYQGRPAPTRKKGEGSGRAYARDQRAFDRWFNAQHSR